MGDDMHAKQGEGECRIPAELALEGKAEHDRMRRVDWRGTKHSKGVASPFPNDFLFAKDESDEKVFKRAFHRVFGLAWEKRP